MANPAIGSKKIIKTNLSGDRINDKAFINFDLKKMFSHEQVFNRYVSHSL